MIKRGWIDADNVRDTKKVETALVRFFGVNRPEDIEILPHAAKKTAVRYSSHASTVGVAASREANGERHACWTVFGPSCSRCATETPRANGIARRRG